MMVGAAFGPEGVFGLGASCPRTNLPRPRPGLRSDPTLSPRSRGEHPEQTAPRLEVGPTAATTTRRPTMDILHARCAGLDLHKKAVVACVRGVGPDGRVHTQTRTFATMTAEIL